MFPSISRYIIAIPRIKAIEQSLSIPRRSCCCRCAASVHQCDPNRVGRQTCSLYAIPVCRTLRPARCRLPSLSQSRVIAANPYLPPGCLVETLRQEHGGAPTRHHKMAWGYPVGKSLLSFLFSSVLLPGSIVHDAVRVTKRKHGSSACRGTIKRAPKPGPLAHRPLCGRASRASAIDIHGGIPEICEPVRLR